MKNPKVSIVVPVFNGEKKLEANLNSILDQTYKNYEVIVVDNNSQDKTKEIIFEFNKKDSRFRYFFEEIRSRAVARNTGIYFSSGEIIVMIDSDCVAPVDWLDKIVKVTSKKEIVVGNYFPVNLNYWTKRVDKYDKSFKKSLLKKDRALFLDTKNFAIKSALLKKIKNANGEYFNSNFKNMEDFEFGLRIMEKHNIFYLENCFILHDDNDSFFSWGKKQFDRGFWVYKIYLNYKKSCLEKNSMFQSISIKNNLFLLPFLFVNLVKNPSDFLFLFTSEIFWRAGIFYSFFKNFKK